MTDYSLVKEQLKNLLHCDDSQAEEYEIYISNAVSCVMPLLKNQEDENDGRVVFLCAAKAYYQINLAEFSTDGVTSFKAGDVSFEKDMSALTNAKELYKTALDDCTAVLDTDAFAFRTV